MQSLDLTQINWILYTPSGRNHNNIFYYLVHLSLFVVVGRVTVKPATVTMRRVAPTATMQWSHCNFNFARLLQPQQVLVGASSGPQMRASSVHSCHGREFLGIKNELLAQFTKC